MRTDIFTRKDEVLQWISEHQSKAEICRRLQCKPDTLEGYLKRWDIDYRGKQGWSKGKALTRKSAAEYLSNDLVKSHVLRLKLIAEGIKEHRCETCTFSMWNDEPIPLELHHRDGDRWNNALENLQVLCPNCHAQTDNHAGKGIKRTAA